MFYKKRIEKLEYFKLNIQSWARTFERNDLEQDKKIKEMQEMLKQHEETIEGLIEVLKSDRRDLNTIINIIKKLDKPTTKGKK